MEQVYLNRPTICETLRGTIKKYKRAHPRLNSSQIARRFGISGSSFNRIENGDIANPSIDQSIKVMTGCGGKEEVSDFIRTYYPQIHESVHGHFIENSQMDTLDESVEKYFADESTYKMMMLATSKCGLCENYVLQEFGRSGHQKFMKLAAKGIFKNIDGRFFAAQKDVYIRDNEYAKVGAYMFNELSEDYKAYGASKDSSYSIVYESVNFDKVKSQLLNITNDYRDEVKKILLDPKNAGNTLVCINTLLKKVNQEQM